MSEISGPGYLAEEDWAVGGDTERKEGKEKESLVSQRLPALIFASQLVGASAHVQGFAGFYSLSGHLRRFRV